MWRAGCFSSCFQTIVAGHAGTKRLGVVEPAGAHCPICGNVAGRTIAGGIYVLSGFCFDRCCASLVGTIVA